MCPIPAFDHNDVLPPYLGSPTSSTAVSPYNCTIMELCQRFATSTERVAILKGFLAFRSQIMTIGVPTGFQWIDGSFVEHIEKTDGRPPRDLDVVTFYGGLDIPQQGLLYSAFPEFFEPTLSKAKYLVDNQAVDCTSDPLMTVEYTRFWIQLFTHKRNNIWKGILNVPINTPSEDNDAMTYLNGLVI